MASECQQLLLGQVPLPSSDSWAIAGAGPIDRGHIKIQATVQKQHEWVWENGRREDAHYETIDTEVVLPPTCPRQARLRATLHRQHQGWNHRWSPGNDSISAVKDFCRVRSVKSECLLYKLIHAIKTTSLESIRRLGRGALVRPAVAEKCRKAVSVVMRFISKRTTQSSHKSTRPSRQSSISINHQNHTTKLKFYHL